jgi:hypothetical protein
MKDKNMNYHIYKKLMKLSLWLNNNGLKQESKLIINKVAVPLGEVITEDEPEERIGRPQTDIDYVGSQFVKVPKQSLRPMEPKLRKLMQPIIPTINIIECPQKIAINLDDDELPKLTISSLAGNKIPYKEGLEEIKNALKYYISIDTYENIEEEKLIKYEEKINNLAQYIQDVSNKYISPDTITILWGVTGEDFSSSQIKLTTHSSPEWVMHDIIHVAEDFELLDKKYSWVSELKEIAKNIPSNFKEEIKNITPGIDEVDYYPTIAYLIVTDPEFVSDYIPEIKDQVFDLKNKIENSIDNLCGKLIFLP